MDALALLVCRIFVNEAERRAEVTVTYGTLALELEGQGGRVGSSGHSGGGSQGMGATTSDGGVEVKPTSSGQLHAMYAATMQETADKYLYTSRQRKIYI